MFKPRFVIKGINRNGMEVQASDRIFNSIYRAELESLEFYGDSRFKTVWVERQGYARTSQGQNPDAAAA
ncbi:MAG: hypothetical protein Hals2KO_19560 [Halioglobus sp.]